MTAPAFIVEGIDSNGLARCCFNALTFLPARSRVDHALLTVDDDLLTVSGSDTYTAAVDGLRIAPTGRRIALGLTREGLAELDKAGREDKRTKDRAGVGELHVYPGDAVTYVDSQARSTTVEYAEPDSEFWQAVDDVFALTEARPEALPSKIAFDPALLGRFAKIKTETDLRVMDCLVTSETWPVLVKIGDTFKAMITPIDREVFADRNGMGALW